MQGVDVSVYQGSFDWASAGVQFGYARISDGSGYIDSTFGANWANMKSAGVLRGAYQFFEPGEDPTAQANLMVSMVGGLLGPGDLPCMIDVEVTGGQSGGTIAANVRTWINVVRAGTGLTPIIYTGPYFWDDNVGDTSFGAIPLWVADYGPSCPLIPNGWSNWTMWQYSDGGGSLDHDVFNGSLSQLMAYAGQSPVRGNLDSVSCDQIAGWAQDPNSPSTAISVDLYLDGPAGTGVDLGRFTAGNARSDLCTAIGSCDHGFSIQTPESLYDGHAHTIYAYGIAVTPGLSNALLGSGSLHCAATLTGDFAGEGRAEVVQFRDDWGSIPRCGRSGSKWDCSNEVATYVGGDFGSGNLGTAIWPGAAALVGDVNGDGKDDVVEYNAAWESIPVCFSTGVEWSCENLKATYIGGLGAGNAGTGIYGASTVLVGDVNGDGMADVIQYNPGWGSIPVCFSNGRGWSCENLKATYIGGVGAGNAGSGVYPGSTVFVADVNGDGKADVVQYNPKSSSIPVCFSTGHGWSCENERATYVGGLGAGNGGSGVYGSARALVADVNGDGLADVVQYDSGGQSIPVCFAVDHGWSCQNSKADYIGGMGAGNAGSGIYGSATNVLVADVNGDGLADVVQYASGWQSIPVCFSTERGWSCDNMTATDNGGAGLPGNGGSAVYPFGVPVAGTFRGRKSSDIVQIDPGSGWTSLPFCALDTTGWECSVDPATVH